MSDQLEQHQLEEHRTALTGYCYRLLGSVFEAEDATQDTLLRAWKAAHGFEQRSSVKTWLYRIATNVCIDHLNGRARRALPIDLTPSAPTLESLGDPQPGQTWVEPILDSQVLTATADPAELIVARESIRLAFIAALQHLPPRQRSVLILRDVLRWSTLEVAELLETTSASVTSALQRARARMAEVSVEDPLTTIDPAADDPAHKELLNRYVDAFQRYDVDALVTLLHKDATQSMPPFAMFLRGRDDIGRWLAGPGRECLGSRLIPLQVNGRPAFAQYRRDPDGGHQPFSIQVLEIDDAGIRGFTHFLDTTLFEQFGLPAHL